MCSIAPNNHREDEAIYDTLWLYKKKQASKQASIKATVSFYPIMPRIAWPWWFVLVGGMPLLLWLRLLLLGSTLIEAVVVVVVATASMALANTCSTCWTCKRMCVMDAVLLLRSTMGTTRTWQGKGGMVDRWVIQPTKPLVVVVVPCTGCTWCNKDSDACPITSCDSKPEKIKKALLACTTVKGGVGVTSILMFKWLCEIEMREMRERDRRWDERTIRRYIKYRRMTRDHVVCISRTVAWR